MSFRTDATDAAIGELGSALFASMRRADQRARGRAYLQGLLRAEGRKSIRGIAAAAGSAATQQRLHHFVSESTWDWSLVRRALAGYLTDRLPPLAWVLHPLLIPKQGTQSVGVSRHFEARLGHTTTAQQAAGLWAVTDEVSYPVQWRLHLSGEWLTDRALRHRMAIPEDLPAETFGTGNVSAFLEAARWPEWVSRPLVLDVRHPELASTVHRLRAAGAPFLARISAHTPLLAGGPADTTDPMPAGAVMAAARHRRRPVSWTEPGTVPVARSRLAATAPVRLPGEGPESGTELLLLGTAALGRGWPAELWLTDLTATRQADLVRMTALMDQVERDRAEVTDRLGLRDFTGRSFGGWHRHVTLVSAAHGLVALTGRRADPPQAIRHTG